MLDEFKYNQESIGFVTIYETKWKSTCYSNLWNKSIGIQIKMIWEVGSQS